MDKRLKITEIAARTQLSISTVSRVLAGKRIPAKKRAQRCWRARASWG
jgi:DNA-binding LacI/PurR family transcriptional regulator